MTFRSLLALAKTQPDQLSVSSTFCTSRHQVPFLLHQLFAPDSSLSVAGVLSTAMSVIVGKGLFCLGESENVEVPQKIRQLRMDDRAGSRKPVIAQHLLHRWNCPRPQRRSLFQQRHGERQNRVPASEPRGFSPSLHEERHRLRTCQPTRTGTPLYRQPTSAAPPGAPALPSPEGSCGLQSSAIVSGSPSDCSAVTEEETRTWCPWQTELPATELPSNDLQTSTVQPVEHARVQVTFVTTRAPASLHTCTTTHSNAKPGKKGVTGDGDVCTHGCW